MPPFSCTWNKMWTTKRNKFNRPGSVLKLMKVKCPQPSAPAPFVHHHQVHKSWHSVCPPHSWWESKKKTFVTKTWNLQLMPSLATHWLSPSTSLTSYTPLFTSTNPFKHTWIAVASNLWKTLGAKTDDPQTMVSLAFTQTMKIYSNNIDIGDYVPPACWKHPLYIWNHLQLPQKLHRILPCPHCHHAQVLNMCWNGSIGTDAILVH